MREVARGEPRRATLGEMQAEVFGSVFFLAQHLARRTDEALKPLGLTTKQWLLLIVMVKRFPAEAPTVSQAAQVYGTSRQNVKQIALQLQKLGYLRVEPDPADGRAQRLTLTDKMAVFRDPRETRRENAYMADLFRGFTAREMETLAALVRRWLKHLIPS